MKQTCLNFWYMSVSCLTIFFICNHMLIKKCVPFSFPRFFPHLLDGVLFYFFFLPQTFFLLEFKIIRNSKFKLVGLNQGASKNNLIEEERVSVNREENLGKAKTLEGWRFSFGCFAVTQYDMRNKLVSRVAFWITSSWDSSSSAEMDIIPCIKIGKALNMYSFREN